MQCGSFPDRALPTDDHVVTDTPPEGTFQAIFQSLRACSVELTGPGQHRLLAVPVLDQAGAVAGGLWGCTIATWLVIEMLFVPEQDRGRGLGGTLIRSAEAEAIRRGCRHAMVDTISPDAARFFERLGFVRFGMLDAFPPGHQRVFYQKQLFCDRRSDIGQHQNL